METKRQGHPASSGDKNCKVKNEVTLFSLNVINLCLQPTSSQRSLSFRPSRRTISLSTPAKSKNTLKKVFKERLSGKRVYCTLRMGSEYFTVHSDESVHAEIEMLHYLQRQIRRIGTKRFCRKYRHAELYVHRFRADGTIGEAMPCKHCSAALRRFSLHVPISIPIIWSTADELYRWTPSNRIQNQFVTLREQLDTGLL